MRQPRALALILGAGFASASTAKITLNSAATTYFVSAAGNDTTGRPNNPGRPFRSPRAAYATIPADITRSGGDHVIELVDNGTYGQLRMAPRITDSTHRIILRARAGTTPTMDALSTEDGSAGRAIGNPVLYIEASHLVVEGLHFRNTNLDTLIGRSLGGSEVMVRLDGSHVTIANNYFDGNGRAPTITDMFLLVCDTASDNLITGNRFDFSGGKGLIYVGAGCTGKSPGKQIIRNNALSRFGNNPQGVCAGINFGGASGTRAGEGSIVENNTIYDNAGGCYGLLDTNGSTLTVRNNIFSKITGRRYAIGCSGVNGSSSGVAYHSLMFGNTHDVESSCGAGGWALNAVFAENPNFVDPAASPPDLHLQATGGCRGNLGAYGNSGDASRLCSGAQSDSTRTIEFETSRVTGPTVTVSPDGGWLVFTMLGKLFRVSTQGGAAEQLTFGSSYESAPAISPDGRLVAFQSDRDGSEGNIFVLTLGSGEITQLTHASWADRPAWTQDGLSVIYLELERTAWMSRDSMPRPPATVRRIRLSGGAPESLSGMGGYWSAFELSNGRVGWTVVERNRVSRLITTRIEIRERDGRVNTLRRMDGVAQWAIPSPKNDGVYLRYAKFGSGPPDPSLMFVPFGEGRERPIASVSGEPGGFAAGGEPASLYAGNLGRLWRIGLPGGRRNVIPFQAAVKLAILSTPPPPKWNPVRPGTVATIRSLQQPRLSPDGSRLVFRVFRHIWQQPLKEGTAVRVDTGDDSELDPVFSPDGRELAFVRYRGRTGDTTEVRVHNFRSKQTRTIGPPSRCELEQLSWSRHGEVIASGDNCDHQVIAIDPVTGAVRELAKQTTDWEPFPQLSADGKTLYFLGDIGDSAVALYRLPLGGDSAKKELLFGLPQSSGDFWSLQHDEASDRWRVAYPLQFRPGYQVTTSTAGKVPTDERIPGWSDGHQISLTPDGKSFLHLERDTLWSEPLTGGAARRIPIRLAVTVPTPPPVLLQRVKVLDFGAGGFGAETSVLLEGGRIKSIGTPEGQAIPAGTRTIDGAGRYVIPGLFDVHAHGENCGNVSARISWGVTSTRNMGGRLAGETMIADWSDLTAAAVPRCFYAGRIFEGPPGRDEDWAFVFVTTEAQIRGYVRSWKAQGAQFIKLYNRVPWPLQRAATEEARGLGLPVQAHGITLEQIIKGVRLGFAGLTHWYNQYEDDVLQMFAAAGTRWDPTLGASWGLELAFRDDPERFRQAAANTPISDDVLRGRWAEALRTVQAGYRRGIVFLPGTDRSPDGLTLQWELEFYSEAGIPPIDILRFATREAAKAVGAEDDLGTIEAGKLADLVVLDANPLESIRNTQRIWRVFKGGWVFDPKSLRP